MSEHLRDYEKLPKTDDDYINENVQLAEMLGQELDDATARAIAAYLHHGQETALYEFACTGAMNIGPMHEELRYFLQSSEPPIEVKKWAEGLSNYALMRKDTARVDGWEELWVQPHAYNADNRCTICHGHIAEPHSPDCIRHEDAHDLFMDEE